MRSEEAKQIWADGMKKSIEVLKPKHLICYGVKPEFDFGRVDVKFFEARKFEKNGK